MFRKYSRPIILGLSIFTGLFIGSRYNKLRSSSSANQIQQTNRIQQTHLLGPDSNKPPQTDKEDKEKEKKASTSLEMPSADDETNKSKQGQPNQEKQIGQLGSNQNEVENIKENNTQEQPKVGQKQTAYFKKNSVNKIKDLPIFNLSKGVQSEDFVLIICDLDYNRNFEEQILKKLNKTAEKRKSSKPLSVYRLSLTDQITKLAFQQKYAANIEEETILLLKNPYDQQFININFKLYINQENLPSIYLSQLRMALDKDSLQREITQMTPNDSFLLYLTDTSNQKVFTKNKVLAKYLELELGNENMENLKICVVDSSVAKDAGVVSSQAKDNTLHLIRKKNQYTYKSPNRWLYGLNPFHVIQNVNIFDKTRNNLIPRYLGTFQTFSSLKIDSPYVCQITIDKNKINQKQERKILKALANIKEQKSYPMISFILKYGQVEYRGEEEEKFSNKRFSLKLANVQEIDKQTFLHEVKNKEQIKMLRVEQSDWMKDTFQYLYKDPQITQQGVKSFFQRCLRSQEPQFYKSESNFKLQSIEKLTGTTFNKTIFDQGPKSHLVFQYSDHCQACQALSPLIEQMDKIFKSFPQIGVEVHSLNCQKNRIKGQPYSPYTPNLYYYSKKWRNTNPLRYPLVEQIKYNGIWGIYNFCKITEELKKIDILKFETHIDNVSKTNVRVETF